MKKLVPFLFLFAGSCLAFNFQSPNHVYELHIEREGTLQVTHAISSSAGGSASYAWATNKGFYQFPITINGRNWNRHTCNFGDGGPFLMTNRVPTGSPGAPYLYGKGWVRCPFGFA